MPPPWPPPSEDEVSHEPAKTLVNQAPEMGYGKVEAPTINTAADLAATAIVEDTKEPIKPAVHETRFAVLLDKFNECRVNDATGALQDVLMDKFYEACELYRDMLSKLGRAAGVVVSDIEHNLSKSKAVYLEAPEERKTVLEYLQLPPAHVGIEKITWLLRGMEFFLTMINLIFTQESGNAAVEAYQRTLMQYHGWMLQQTVKLAMRAMPSKDGIVQSEGLVLGTVSAERRKQLCEHDAPPASSAGLEVVQWIIATMKKQGKWDAKKA
mmetsp:Transcript_30790/g.57709  ORF Transcript_30790/g.57709 Transcript_30790/m.57709 type:complete len:268 (-) Transcript_30790:66-869(-)